MAGLTETASRNLAGELARHRKTREDLAKAWGCAPKTVDTRLRGQTPLTTDEIEKAAHILGLEPFAPGFPDCCYSAVFPVFPTVPAWFAIHCKSL